LSALDSLGSKNEVLDCTSLRDEFTQQRVKSPSRFFFFFLTQVMAICLRCSDKDEYCVTNVASVGIGMCWLITKKCSETCPHHNFSLGLASYTSYCCQTFLCNPSACPGPRASTAPDLPLGIVSSSKPFIYPSP
uniref:Snake toxin/toxin-like domain-containing protein n=1 Tax=Buteo japonicus TaxID=224669 RepID=A0A8C0BNT6_9AVES